MDPEDAIWDALNDDRRRAAPNDHERNDHHTNANRNTNNHNDFAALPFGGPLLVPQPEEGEDPNELLAAVARMHLADIEALREAGAGEDALLALDLFGDELRRALEMVEDREVAAHVQDDNGARGNEDRRQGEGGQDRRDEPAQPRAEGPEPTLASLIRRIPGAWALPLPLGVGAQDQPHEDRPRHDEGAPPGDDAHPEEQQNAPAGGVDHHDHNHDHEHDDQVWNPGWLLSAARQWMLGNGTPPTDHGDPDIPPECVVCQDVIAPGELIRAPCGHTYDVHCMNTVFMNAARDEALFPPRCCKTTIPTDLVRGRIPTTTLATFSARAAEFATPKRLYCAAPTCSAFLGARYTGWFFAKAILCPGCGAKTCSRCAHKVDPNERHRCSSAEDENQIAAVAAQEEWARCPDCEAFVELVIGCNHMTCRCGAEFCYVCSRRWKTCGCPWWDEDRLLAVREERHERRRRRRRERREREAREQAAADGEEEDVEDEPAQAEVAPAPEPPQAVAPLPPPDDAPGPDADALAPPAPHVDEAPLQPPAAPGPLMQALVGPPPGEGGAVFMRPSLRTRRNADAPPPEENAAIAAESTPAPAPEPAPLAAPIAQEATPQEIAPADDSSTPVEPPAEPLVAAAVPEAAVPAMEDIPRESEDSRAPPAEEPQARPSQVSRRKSKALTRQIPIEPVFPAAEPSCSAPAEEASAAERCASSPRQLRNEEPIPVPAPASQELPSSDIASKEPAPAEDVVSRPSHRHRSHSHGHRSSHHASRSGSRATRVYHFVPPQAQEVDNGAEAPSEDIHAATDVAGPDVPPNDDAQDLTLDPVQEAHVRQVLHDILPPPVSSRNRRPSHAPVPPSPSPAPPELPKEQASSSTEVFYTPPVHSDDLRVPAASTSTVKVYAAAPIKERTSSSRSSKSGSSQSTKRASSRTGRESVFQPTAGPSASKAPYTPRHAEGLREEALSSHRTSEPSTSRKKPPTTGLPASSSRPRSSFHRDAEPPVVAPIPTHGRASSAASALDPRASSTSLARPATQPPLASSSSRQNLRRSESLQRETRARRETREHWERVHAAASALTSQQQVEAEAVKETSTVDTPASSSKHGHAEEPTRRGREEVRPHRESKHGKGRTVTYMTFEAAQYGSVPAEWVDDNTALAPPPNDPKGKRRATDPLLEAASQSSATRSTIPSSPIPHNRTRYQWDPPPKPVYKLHARLRAPVDPLAYASRLMRKTAGARRTLQHVPPPKDRPPLMLPKERDKLRVYQRPPPVVYAQTTMQHALLPTKGPVPPEAKPVLSRQSSDARIERSSAASTVRPSHLDDHKPRPPSYTESHRSATRTSSSRSVQHAAALPIHSPRSTVSPRTDHHVHPSSSHHPRSGHTASPRIEDVPLHQIYSRFAPVSTLHPPSPQPSHRFAPVSTLHPPIPPPPPEAAPVFACTSSRQVMECALPPEGPPVQARTGRHSHPTRRESDPLDFSTMVSRVPASESLYIHSTEFKRALKKWDKCPHDLWAYGFGPGQCLGCRRLLEDTVYRCESCRAVACADCMHDKF